MLKMKKTYIILVTLFFICGTSALSFAQTAQAAAAKKAVVSTEIIKGKIASINAGKNEIVVKEKTIVVSPEAVSSLKVGDQVKVTLKAGSNVAVSVKRLVKKPVSTKK